MKLKMAGNTNLGCVRKNNEDNFCVSADLQLGLFANASCPWGTEQVVDLGPKGVLLVVADGMGGTNAGEVASERAVVKAAECFAPDRITPDIASRPERILSFMEQAIVACDQEVKNWGNTHPESRGMGTTMVMGWILDGKLYVAWCGDSRAYVFRPSENKIYQVSKDHSYVQLLVDKEMLTREETFDHPQGNIITRSLSHGQPPARPESLPVPYELCDGDIVLLCSDGLSGMLHDEEMADIISNSADDLEQIVTNLINAARQAGGNDNITAVLCKVENGGQGSAEACARFFAMTEAALNGPGVSGGAPKPTPLFRNEPPLPQQGPITILNYGQAPAPAPMAASAPVPASPRKSSAIKKLIPLFIVVGVLFVCAAGWLAWSTYMHFSKHASERIEQTDIDDEALAEFPVPDRDDVDEEPLPAVRDEAQPTQIVVVQTQPHGESQPELEAGKTQQEMLDALADNINKSIAGKRMVFDNDLLLTAIQKAGNNGGYTLVVDAQKMDDDAINNLTEDDAKTMCQSLKSDLMLRKFISNCEKGKVNISFNVRNKNGVAKSIAINTKED